jgi:hypothetical protein
MTTVSDALKATGATVATAAHPAAGATIAAIEIARKVAENPEVQKAFAKQMDACAPAFGRAADAAVDRVLVPACDDIGEILGAFGDGVRLARKTPGAVVYAGAAIIDDLKKPMDQSWLKTPHKIMWDHRCELLRGKEMLVYYSLGGPLNPINYLAKRVYDAQVRPTLDDFFQCRKTCHLTADDLVTPR